MKILHSVEFYAPSTGGAQEVVRQLSERMAQAGHQVTIATTALPERKSKTINGVTVAEFAINGNEVVGISGETTKYQDFLINGDFDIIMNYAAQQWATDLTFEIIDQIKAKKVLVPCGYSALNNPDFKDYFAKLPSILRKYQASIYLTKHFQDYKFAKQHGLNNLHVIPNGADEKEFETLENNDFRQRHNIKGFFILTVSNHTGSKGHAETLAVFEKLNFAGTLVIIGGGQTESDGCYKDCQASADRINKTGDGKKVLLLSLDRPETLQAFKSADLFLFLSNIEASPIVLFEAAAAQLAFVAADVGNSKEIAKWTKGGLIVKVSPDEGRLGNVVADIDDAVKQAEKLQRRTRYRLRLARKARRNWQKRFTWQKITEQYLELYERLVV